MLAATGARFSFRDTSRPKLQLGLGIEHHVDYVTLHQRTYFVTMTWRNVTADGHLSISTASRHDLRHMNPWT
ncbi:hypothetical protein J1614_004300 [Plenodomus biglobosus]|nr:hypothetical protein J1614_004300 [Plenodomus biglobosus]